MTADALPPETVGKAIEVWFQDEARVGQQGTLSHVWAPRGSRPARVRDCRRQNACLFGAICPARAVGAAIVMPRVSSEAMTLHLAEISKQVGASAHAVLTLRRRWLAPARGAAARAGKHHPAALAAVCA